MREVFVGSEAVAAGRISEHELRRWYQPVFRDVYMPKSVQLSLRDRTECAWLWSKRRAVIAGVAAAALHGAQWIDPGEPVELIAPSARRQEGLIVRNEALAENEVTRIAGLRVTTPARTAFDLGRHLPVDAAITRIDALQHAIMFSLDDVWFLAGEHKGARGIRQLRSVLPLVDGGAASPRETWLRLLLIRAGFPRPVTQIPVMDRWRLLAVLDMGWPEIKVAVEYDGDHHRTNRTQYAKDQRRIRDLERLGWIIVRVIVEDRPEDVLRRVAEAVRRRTHSSRSTVA